MRRRALLKGLAAAAVGGVAGFRLPLAAAADHAGKFFAFVQADGGWDPTSFCDPKANAAGEPEINHWAREGEIRQAGNLRYAPFARNAAFFEKYHRRMLVINGVDAQTNSHTVGVVHNWSGRNSEGYPSATALLAARYAPDGALPYLSFGGFSATGGVTRFTRLHGPAEVLSIAHPNRDVWADDEIGYLLAADWDLIAQRERDRMARLASAPGLLPRAARNRRHHQASLAPAAVEGLKRFADALPSEDEFQQPEEYESRVTGTYSNELRRQAQLAVLAFKTGAGVSADLWLGGFDTHRAHDADHEWLLGALTDSVDFLWDYAEQHGVADRLVVVIGSDFGRTNHYNAEGGKDHWPIGSYVVMEKNQPWTNRVVGETDGLHFAQKINPRTLRRDDANGTIIYPKHFHKALRRYLGIEDSPGAQRFPFNGTEDFRSFG